MLRRRRVASSARSRAELVRCRLSEIVELGWRLALPRFTQRPTTLPPRDWPEFRLVVLARAIR